MNILFRRFKN